MSNPVSADSGIQAAKSAALEVLRHNAKGPFLGLPRTAGWGYPEPYTRDLMIALFGVLVSGDEALIARWRKVLSVLARNQSARGQIPSLAHDPENLGASDTTPLFLLGVGLYRKATGETDFLDRSVEDALEWMRYQSPDDSLMVTQQPTTDWRDEQWVLGHGLYVNSAYCLALRLLGHERDARHMAETMNHFEIDGETKNPHRHEGFAIAHQPYLAAWTFKIYACHRFDLLGNSLAALAGVLSPTRTRRMITWIEKQCCEMRSRGVLSLQAPPCYFPYIQPEDSDWRPRYEKFNPPGHYHNGGIWPFVGGFYIAMLVQAGRLKLARENLLALTEIVRVSREHNVAFGFNEWLSAQDGQVRGQDWQTWSAAMYLYATVCVEQGSTPLISD